MKLPIPDSLPDWERELEELVTAQLRGDMTREQHERLSDMLRTHTFVRKAYLRRMQLEAMLDWEYAELNENTVDIADERQERFEQAKQKNWTKWIAPAGIAAMLTIGLYFGFHETDQPIPDKPSIATILNTEINQWHKDNQSPHIGQNLESGGPVILKGGTTTIGFKNGTRATLEGPAKLITTATDGAQLLSGNLTLRTPYDSEPFILELPNQSSLEIGNGSTLAITGAETDNARIYLIAGQASLKLEDGRLRPLHPKMAANFDGLTRESHIYQPEIAPHPPSLADGGTFYKRTWIDQLDLRLAEQGWGVTRSLSSVDGGPICIANKKFTRGFGTHAQGYVKIALPEGCMRLIAHVGQDDENKGGSVRFMVLSEGKEIWRSKKVMHHGDAPERVDIDISGLRTITLVSDSAGNGIGGDHADWANACIIHRATSPQIIPYQANLDSFVLTPPAAPEPKINGARVVGIQPRTPFLFKIPATGEKPIVYSAKDLPQSLRLDSKTGIITGYLGAEGSHLVTLSASNELGTASRQLRIECGRKLALTPPMGWNSWLCWGTDINEQRMRSTAKAMVKHGLIDYGWSYITMDDGWQGARGGPLNALQANSKFTDMEKLCSDIHNMGLKAGIFTSMNISSPSGFTGSSAVAANGNAGDMAVPLAYRSTTSQVYGVNPDDSLTTRIGQYVFLDQDALQWADWGFDYVKINGGENIIGSMRSVRSALNATSRSILFMTNSQIGRKSPRLMFNRAQVWAAQGDGTDSWDHIFSVMRQAPLWQAYTTPGSWPSQGLLQVGSKPSLHPNGRCRLTAAEQYAHFSSLCMMSAPLMLSCDLENLDTFTLSLLKNAELIEVNQDPLGKAAKPIAENPAIWIKPMEDGSSVIAFFNYTGGKQTMSVNLPELGFQGNQRVRDLWRQQDLADTSGTLTADVETHGVMVFRLWNR